MEQYVLTTHVLSNGAAATFCGLVKEAKNEIHACGIQHDRVLRGHFDWQRANRDGKPYGLRNKGYDTDACSSIPIRADEAQTLPPVHVTGDYPSVEYIFASEKVV